MPEILYSCVVDASPVLYHQTMVWAWTAIHLAGIDPSQLVVHLVVGSDDRLRRDLARIGVRCIPVQPFAKGTPSCNKLVQLDSEALLSHPRVVLSDCDIAWIAPVDGHLFGGQPRAKVVDLANPPLELLEPLFLEAGFPDAATSITSIGNQATLHNNCNGGLYLLSGGWLRRLQEPWKRWLDWVEARAVQLGPYSVHMFQVSFALAMEELGARVEHLPLEYNFPTHTNRTAECSVESDIRALHFHRAYDTSGLLLPTGVARVDKAVTAVNTFLWPRFAGAWWMNGPELVTRESVHGRFRTRRYDHVTQQLETYGAHTRNELAMVLAFLRPGDQVIDVGAHIGTFTVPFARAVGPEGRVVSVEPGIDAFDLLLENLALNGVLERVRAECALVCEHPGAYRAAETADHTSATYYVSTEGVPSLECLQLDSLAANLDSHRPLRLIKIDVEGMELSVLRSAEALITEHRPVLYVEVVSEQLLRGGSTVAELEAFLVDRHYGFFRNIGERNSTNDRYEILRIATLDEGGPFFDCLAIPLERLSEEPALLSSSSR
ncbi:MAG: FkbM family methyltransferase [Vicinamibacterales bacterium]|nr:FkbM family methyltransferase [Vicinamibacterales bacterium]